MSDSDTGSEPRSDTGGSADADPPDDPVGSDLLRRVEDGICWITINRPETNIAPPAPIRTTSA